MPEREPESQTPPSPRAPEASHASKGKRRSKFRGALLGLGLDGSDGHTRLTKGDNFLLVGGSGETHEKMQDIAIRLNERLKKKGKDLADVSLTELRDLASGL